MKENIQIWRLPHQNEVDFVRIENAKAALPPQVSDCYKLVFIERGARAFRCRKLRFTASAGDLILIPPGETHEADAIPESPSVIRILQLPHEEIERFSPVDGRAFHFGTARFTPYVNDRSVVGAYRQVHLPASTFQSSLEVDSKLGELIRALIDSTGRDERSDRGALHEAAAARRLKHYIEDNFADDLRLSDLARIAGLNPRICAEAFAKRSACPRMLIRSPCVWIRHACSCDKGSRLLKLRIKWDSTTSLTCPGTFAALSKCHQLATPGR